VIARNPTAAQNGNVTNTIPAGALTTTEGATSPAIKTSPVFSPFSPSMTKTWRSFSSLALSSSAFKKAPGT